MISVGQLNEQVIIQKHTTRPTPLGNVTDYVSLAPVFGNVKFVSDRERFSAGATTAKLVARVTIRNLGNEISPHDRIRIGDTTYSIAGVKPIENRRFIELLVEYSR